MILVKNIKVYISINTVINLLKQFIQRTECKISLNYNLMHKKLQNIHQFVASGYRCF